MSDAKKKRHNATGGGIGGWYANIVPTEPVGAACVDCGVRVGMVDCGGRCVRCDQTRRREARERRAAIPSTE